MSEIPILTAIRGLEIAKAAKDWCKQNQDKSIFEAFIEGCIWADENLSNEKTEKRDLGRGSK